MEYTGEWVMQSDGETLCESGRRVAKAFDPEHPEQITLTTKANARLIVAAINACQKVNPNNPLAVAESISEMYEALTSIAHLLANPLTTREEATPSIRLHRAMDEAWLIALRTLAKAKGKETP